MKKFILLFFIGTIFQLTSLIAAGQKKNSTRDKGLVVYKLGNDTTTIQYFEWDNKMYVTTILTLSGQLTKYTGIGELDETGDLKEVRSKTYRMNETGNWKLQSEGENIFNGDSSIYMARSNEKIISRRAVAGKGIVSNAADACSFFVFPYMGFFAPTKINDTLFHCQLSFGECRAFFVTRLAKEELKIGSGVMGKIKLFVDKKNRITGADAVGSSLNFIAIVDRGKMDYNKYINTLADNKFASTSFAPRTFRDTAVAVMQNKKIEVDFWRPYTRGREIFGSVVPWNRIWRTGANNATQLRSDAVLSFNGEKLPAGKYSIWTYPTESSWTLFINKKADVWGTEYDAAADIMKIPLAVEKTMDKVEVFKISLIPQPGSKLRLQIEWDDRRAWADFVIE